MGAFAPVMEIKYGRTKDLRRMLTSAQLAEAIIKEVKRQFARHQPETNIFGLVPARAATSMEYRRGAKTARVWNEGGKKEKVDFPLKDDWRTSDGNPFGVPNGPKSSEDNPEALYLVRHQDRDFSGPVGFGDGGDSRRRYFVADVDWSDDSGVSVISHEATAPLVGVPKEELVKIADPKTLRQDAEQLRQLAGNLSKRFGDDAQAQDQVVKPMLEKAARFIEVAEAIEEARK